MTGHVDEELLRELRREAQRWGLPEEEAESLARLAGRLRSLPSHAPTEVSRQGWERLSVALAQGRGGRRWGLLGYSWLRAAAMVSVVVLGLTALGGAYASGLRLPERVAVGPLQPLAAPPVSEVARDNHGQDVSQAARQEGKPQEVAQANHGQQVSQTATSGGDVTSVARDNHGQRVSSASQASSQGRKVELKGTVQSVSPQGYVVDGVTVRVGPGTRIEGPIGPGTLVEVEGVLLPDNTIEAWKIEAKDHHKERT